MQEQTSGIDMQSGYQILLALGCILFLGMAAEMVGRRTIFPRVTLLLLLGILVGDQVLDLIPEVLTSKFDIIANVTLLMVGFLLGGQLTPEVLKNSGKQIISISFFTALGTTLMVLLALVLVGIPLEVAILLGCISAATAPAATADTVQESGQQNSFSRLLLSVVALDDVWALLLFSLGITLTAFLQQSSGLTTPLMAVSWEIGGALLLGIGIGWPAAYLTGRLKPGRPMLTEGLGLVFVCGGLAMWLGVSFLIAAMMMGAVIRSLAEHHEHAFHEIENVEWPFMVIFFVLAGASLEIDAVLSIGLLGMVYIIARIAGKIVGAQFGARIGGANASIQHWMGLALLPQAGVAIGMGLVAAVRFPEYRQIILPLVISTTVIFELFGPMSTRFVINHMNHKKDS
jgi:Kef-type K+ transport system membrane component KefB